MNRVWLKYFLDAAARVRVDDTYSSIRFFFSPPTVEIPKANAHCTCHIQRTYGFTYPTTLVPPPPSKKSASSLSYSEAELTKEAALPWRSHELEPFLLNPEAVVEDVEDAVRPFRPRPEAEVPLLVKPDLTPEVKDEVEDADPKEPDEGGEEEVGGVGGFDDVSLLPERFLEFEAEVELVVDVVIAVSAAFASSVFLEAAETLLSEKEKTAAPKATPAPANATPLKIFRQKASLMFIYLFIFSLTRILSCSRTVNSCQVRILS